MLFLAFSTFLFSKDGNFVDIILSNLQRIYDHTHRNYNAWNTLAELCDNFGPRLSGSENLEKSVDWIENKLRLEGYDSVWSEQVMVPKWVRVHEDCEIVYPRRKVLPIMAYGGSVSTPDTGILAEVIVVNSFEDLEKNKGSVKGKIVVYNPPYEGYGKTVQYRWLGAVKAAQYGAVAALCRPVSPMSLNNPHTGVMHYEDTVTKIPFASITEEDALLLERFQRRGIVPKLFLKILTRDEGFSPSRNVIAQIRGSVFPNEIIAFGGHIDSWDAGSGAHDDAGGCVASWYVLKTFKELGIRPKRTLRLVFWVNEENGLEGGKKYAELHKYENHKLLFEFDSGIFPPNRIGFTGPDTLWEKIVDFKNYFSKFYPNVEIQKGGGGVDISPMMKLGYPGGSLGTDDKGKYFWFHHSHKDTPDKIDPKDLNDCVSIIAMFLYLYSEIL
ncbi:MAG: M20/M25/M40 family metallo-hydrolase [Ignavibacteria bacterium]|nr:M20/M25/M40 family metallo-hydrolase [Ignavibacteria bacterium]